MKRIILKKNEERRIQGGHPWVYDNEVLRIVDGKGDDAPSAELVAGETADIETHHKKYLGRAFVNPASKIIARVYSPSKEGVDEGFYKRRLRNAIERRAHYGKDKSCRIVFAEADFLPGLIIDRFAGWSLAAIQQNDFELPLSADVLKKTLGEPLSFLVVQILCFGMETRREMLLSALNETITETFGAPSGIIEKSTAAVREAEGLPLREGIIAGSLPQEGLVIFENGHPFIVELLSGQKTGHFLDQAENHAAAEKAVRGKKRVLDAFCYTGGFSIHCAHGGAEEIIAADTSSSALNILTQNAKLNGVSEKIKTVQSDIFELLTKYEREKERFDMIILDPPAFAKSHSALEGAIAGYKEINLKALKLLNAGGVLMSCSCSAAMDEIKFKKMIRAAACDAERRIVQTDFRYQAGDHPILVGYGESEYLKCGCYTTAAE